MPEKGIRSNLKNKNVSNVKPSYLNIKFDSSRVQSVPDLFAFYYNELKQRMDEVASHEATVLKKANLMIHKIITQQKVAGTSGPPARKNGYEIASFHPTNANLALARLLENDPNDHAQRIALALDVLQAGRELTTEQIRQVMMHLALPIGMMHYDVEGIQGFLSAYRLYQTRLLSEYQRKDVTIQKYAKKTNDYSIKSSHKERARHLSYNYEILKRLIQRQEKVENTMSLLQPLNRRELLGALDGTVDIPPKSNLDQVRDMVEKKLSGVITSLMEIGFLHPTLHEAITLLQRMDKENPNPHFMQARLWMQQLKVRLIQQEVTQEARGMLQGCLKKVLMCYGRSLKLLPKAGAVTQLQRQIFLGHATACITVYSLRNVLKVPPEVYRKTLVQGRDSLHKSGLEEIYDKTNLFERYGLALDNEELLEFALSNLRTLR